MCKKFLTVLTVLFLLLSQNIFAHNEKNMHREIYSSQLAEKWTGYEKEEAPQNKLQKLSQLKETVENHNSITPVTQLKDQQKEIALTLLKFIEELEKNLSSTEINSEKCRFLELKIQEMIFTHLEFEKTISDFKSEQFWKMTRITLVVLIIFIFTTVFLTFTYNSTKRRAKKAKEFHNQMIQVQEEERQRLSRELHDTVTQDIRTNLLYIRNLKERKNNPDNESEKLLEQIEKLESQNLINIRNIIRNLTPPEIESANLHHLLAEYCNNVSQTANIKCTFYAEKEINFEKLNGIQKLNIFRIIQESVTNAIKHADATEINIIVRRESENSSNLIFFISDDGHGFTENSLAQRSQQSEDIANQSAHLGLQGMKTRARLLDAKLDVFSDEDCGTEIRIVVPFLV